MLIYKTVDPYLKKSEVSMVLKNKRGFTLIELLVVIAIIALLLAIVVPAMAKAKDYVKRVICENNARQCGIAVNLYAQANDQAVVPNYEVSSATIATPSAVTVALPGGTTPAATSFTPDPYNSYMVYHPDQKKANSTSYRPFHLAVFYELGYIDVPKVFYCPAQPPTTVNYAIPYYYDFYIGQGNPSDYSNPAAHMKSYLWGTVLPADTRGPSSALCRTSFNYWVYGKRKLTEIKGYKPIIFDNIQEWEVIPHRKGRDFNSIPQGLTALYADGHVSFCSDPFIFDDTNGWPWNKNSPVVGDGPGNDILRFNEILRRIQAH
jgi:prepilin-type N-terminal cleavage/methylation domain-containing protein